MLFNSPIYIFAFLPVVLITYFALNRSKKVILGRIWLVSASLFFYGYWNPVYLVLIIGSMLFNFYVGSALHKFKSGEEGKKRNRKLLLALGIIANLSLLGYFKYSDFFIHNVNWLLGADLPLQNLLLPLAISFFTFQQIAYLVDCYQFDTQEYDLLSYALFVSFFPQLIAGPIVHHKEMMPQFSRLRNAVFHWQNFSKGVLIFCIGLFKKVVIADTFALWANAGFDSQQPLSLFEAWGVSLSYTFQLYYDFSGYSDMAIGAALMFNIRLPLNFNSPYKAKNIQDFWRRWHMTLSRWLRDYLYIPLGGNRLGSFRTYSNLMATFVLGGLWHGAGWTFVLWGALHGVALALHRMWQQLGLRMSTWLAWSVTFLFVHITWVFFRAETLESAFAILRGMAGLNGIGSTVGFAAAFEYFSGMSTANWQISEGSLLTGSLNTLYWIAIFGVVALFARNSIELAMEKRRFSIKHAVFVGVSLASSILLGIATTESEFLYFNF